MRREERVTVHGPVKEQQPDGMSHRGWGLKDGVLRMIEGEAQGEWTPACFNGEQWDECSALTHSPAQHRPTSNWLYCTFTRP